MDWDRFKRAHDNAGEAIGGLRDRALPLAREAGGSAQELLERELPRLEAQHAALAVSVPTGPAPSDELVASVRKLSREIWEVAEGVRSTAGA